VHNSFAPPQFPAGSCRILKRQQNWNFSRNQPVEGARSTWKDAFFAAVASFLANGPSYPGQKRTRAADIFLDGRPKDGRGRINPSESLRECRLRASRRPSVRERNSIPKLISPNSAVVPLSSSRKFVVLRFQRDAVSRPLPLCRFHLRRFDLRHLSRRRFAASKGRKVGRSEGRKVGRSEGRKVGRKNAPPLPMAKPFLEKTPKARCASRRQVVERALRVSSLRGSPPGSSDFGKCWSDRDAWSRRPGLVHDNAKSS
jgi:hypothetical protein